MPTKQPRSTLAIALPVPTELIARRIYLIRGQKVMLDSDLADLYQVEIAMSTASRRISCFNSPDRSSIL